MIPKINEYMRRRTERAKSDTKSRVKLSPVEEEIHKEEYNVMMGTLMDYSELSIRFGFVTLFVCSCPIAPIIGNTKQPSLI